MHDPLQPPGSFDDFTYFDPALHNAFPSPPPLPSSAELFSASETTDILGFLDNLNWDLEAEVQSALNLPSASPPLPPPPTPPPFGSLTAMDTMPMTLQNAIAMSLGEQGSNHPEPEPMEPSQPSRKEAARVTRSQRRPSTATTVASTASASTSASPPEPEDMPSPSSSSSHPKQLLSTPQKRLNHIMSEQKRRNAIRDGYVQLTALLAPAGAPPGAGMPTRGRPKGSGSRAAGRGRGGGFKGKSGILFRAVEYIHWLEEGRGALLDEVIKAETAAGMHRA